MFDKPYWGPRGNLLYFFNDDSDKTPFYSFSILKSNSLQVSVILSSSSSEFSDLLEKFLSYPGTFRTKNNPDSMIGFSSTDHKSALEVEVRNNSPTLK